MSVTPDEEGLGYLWVNDPTTGLISSLAEDGTRGEIVIPTDGPVIEAGSQIRSVTEAGGYLWLMDGDYPNGAAVTRFDSATGELQHVSLAPGLLSMTEFDGSLWVTSNTDHLLMRVDPATGEIHRYPMPGNAGGVFVADGSLWVTLYHPGVVIRIDTDAALIESAEVVVDRTHNDHRLVCTASGQASGPTVILEPYEWIDYGSWSVVQAQLSNEGFRVCADGYLRGDVLPAQRAADLDEALTAAGIEGPFVLVATGDGVHATRLFASGRDAIAGVVLADPVPIGFETFFNEQLPDGGHPPFIDLDATTSAALGGFGDVPLVVIGQDPEAVFLSRQFIHSFGRDTAEALNDYWQNGLEFYAGLSTDSQSVLARGTGLHMLVWDRGDLVVQEVLNVLTDATD